MVKDHSCASLLLTNIHSNLLISYARTLESFSGIFKLEIIRNFFITRKLIQIMKKQLYFVFEIRYN